MSEAGAAYRHLHDDAVRALTAWQAPDAAQEALRRGYLEHLHAHPEGVAKAGPPEHLTAGVLLFSAGLDAVLLTLHGKAGVWLQLGGHLEPEDASLYAAAAREAREESGIDGVRVLPEIAQLDRHLLVGSFGRCREHLDVRFAGVAPPGAQPVRSAESRDLAWWPLDALPEPTAAEMAALARACRRVLDGSADGTS